MATGGDSAAGAFGNIGQVFLDFDDTITVGLSTNVQVKAVIEAIAKRMTSPEEAAQFVQERKALIAKFVTDYDREYKQNLESLMAQFPKGAFDMDAINKAMDVSAEFDQRWNQIGLDYKVFAGVRKDDFLKFAPMTPLQDNALDAIRALQDSGIDVSVTSINWSAEWIKIVLGDRSSVASNGAQLPRGHVKVYSNEMIYENGVATGHLESLMDCGRDKGRVIQKLLDEAKETNGTGTNTSVFVGDSFYDIQPLLLVDIGIVFGQNESLIRFADHFGIQIKPLSEAKESDNASGSPVLYSTNSWLEIAEVLLGEEKARQYVAAAAQ